VKISGILKWVVYVAVFISCSNPVFANTEKECYRSTEGKDFWFGFMESRNYIESHRVKILVTSRETTNFTITIGTSEEVFGNYTVEAVSYTHLTLPTTPYV
jgi:hypothetical protein